MILYSRPVLLILLLKSESKVPQENQACLFGRHLHRCHGADWWTSEHFELDQSVSASSRGSASGLEQWCVQKGIRHHQSSKV